MTNGKRCPLAQLLTLKLDGLAAGMKEQLVQPMMGAFIFGERLALLVKREVHVRNDPLGPRGAVTGVAGTL